MLQFKEFSAWVSIEGVPAEEHGVEVRQDSKTVTCWIQSEEEKAFEINVKDHKATSVTNLRYWIDGDRIPGGKFIRKRGRVAQMKGCRISPELEKRFQFGRLSLTDNEDAVTGSSEEIGEIKITVTRTRLMDRRPLKISLGPPQERVFHEKSKKGALVAHQTRFGPATPTPRKQWARHCKDYGGVVVTFCFRYRPSGALCHAMPGCSGGDVIPPAALQAQGIIRPPPSPKRSKHLTSKVDPTDIIEISDSDSDNELQRLQVNEHADPKDQLTNNLQARVKELEAKRPHKKVKREQKDKTEVKQESIGMVLDLT